MNCKRCGETGAKRREVRLQNGSALAVYLCEECAETERLSGGVSELATTPER